MKERFNFAFGLLVGLFLAGVVLSVLIITWGRVYPLPYQAPIPIVQSIATPADLGELTARVKNLENAQVYNDQVLSWNLDQKLLIFGWLALFITLAAGFLGIKTYSDLDKVINDAVRRALDKALYHLDPTNLRIWIVSYDKAVTFKGDRLLDETGKPKSDKKKNPVYEIVESNVLAEMQLALNRIQLTGLLNTKSITELNQKCFDGVTVIPVFDPEMENDFRNFLERNKNDLDPQRAAFVLYTRDYYVSQTRTLAKYENLAAANMLPTVASTILTVGRGLSNARPANKDKEDDRK